jgi:hypothetical protein
MSESSDKPDRQKASGVSAGTDVQRIVSETNVSNQRRVRKTSGRISALEKQKLRRNAYGPKMPAMLAKILGPPPLLESEDPQLFSAFFSLIAAEYDPKTTSDWLDVKNLVLSHWEQMREDRIKIGVIRFLQEEDLEDWGRPITYIITKEDAKL